MKQIPALTYISFLSTNFSLLTNLSFFSSIKGPRSLPKVILASFPISFLIQGTFLFLLSKQKNPTRGIEILWRMEDFQVRAKKLARIFFPTLLLFIVTSFPQEPQSIKQHFTLICKPSLASLYGISNIRQVNRLIAPLISDLNVWKAFVVTT